MSHRIPEIDRTLRRGIYSLCQSLYTEWPLPDDDKNEISEANLTIHIAHSFLSDHYSAYSERAVKSINGTAARNTHHDLVMFLPGQEEYIIAEFKRFITSDSKEGPLSDIDRIHNHAKESKHPIIGIVCFMTRDRSIRKWWMNYGESPLPDNKRSTSWSGIQEYLSKWKENGAQLGYVHLPHHEDDDFYHAVVYSIFEVSQ